MEDESTDRDSGFSWGRFAGYALGLALALLAAWAIYVVFVGAIMRIPG